MNLKFWFAGRDSQQYLGKVLEGRVFTEVDRVNTDTPETLGTRLLAVLARAVNLVALAAFDEPELAREEDFIAFSGTFEPFAQELFTVAIEAILTVSTPLHIILDR